MSFVRRAALVSLAAAALVTGVAAGSAVAASSAPTALAADGPFGGHGHGDQPIRLGPFMIPSEGRISGGFGWDTSNGGGFGF